MAPPILVKPMQEAVACQACPVATFGVRYKQPTPKAAFIGVLLPWVTQTFMPGAQGPYADRSSPGANKNNNSAIAPVMVFIAFTGFRKNVFMGLILNCLI